MKCYSTVCLTYFACHEQMCYAPAVFVRYIYIEIWKVHNFSAFNCYFIVTVVCFHAVNQYLTICRSLKIQIRCYHRHQIIIMLYHTILSTVANWTPFKHCCGRSKFVSCTLPIFQQSNIINWIYVWDAEMRMNFE